MGSVPIWRKKLTLPCVILTAKINAVFGDLFSQLRLLLPAVSPFQTFPILNQGCFRNLFLKVVLYFLSSFFVLSDYVACGDASWSYHYGSCYKFIQQHKDFDSANQHCKALGSYLVEIEREQENAFVAGFSKDQDIWIALSDRKKEGQWIWETSRKIANYTRWNTGEPNNKGGGNGRAHCALIWRHYHIDYWDDRNCDQRKYFVCERGRDGTMVKNSFHDSDLKIISLCKI